MNIVGPRDRLHSNHEYRFKRYDRIIKGRRDDGLPRRLFTSSRASNTTRLLNTKNTNSENFIKD